MFQHSKGKYKSYGIIGLGRFGSALALQLASAECDLLVMDQNEEKVNRFREVTDNALVIETIDKKSLLETGIHNCDIVIVCIGEEMSSSILITLHLISIGIPTVIAKANSAEHGEILKKLGAQVVYPERDMAVRLASCLENSLPDDILELDLTGQ